MSPTPPPYPEYKLALLGFGNVGQAFIELLLDKGEGLAANPGLIREGLPQILDPHYIPHIEGLLAAVGHPDFQSGNLYLASDKGIRFKGYIVLVPEKLGQEKVPVLVIIQSSKFKFVQCSTSLRHYGVIL